MWFEPMFPPEYAETVRASENTKDFSDKAKLWEIPHCLAFVDMTHQNVEETDDPPPENKFRYLSFQSSECQKTGLQAEQEFLKLCEQSTTHIWKRIFITESELYDYRHHVDFMFSVKKFDEKDFFKVWVDVKGMRALRRGWSPQSEFMWVELHSNGWLFGGKASVIALQIFPNVFLLFDREKLAEYVKHVVKILDRVVYFPEQSYLRVYVRPKRSDLDKNTTALSLISTQKAFEASGCGIMH